MIINLRLIIVRRSKKEKGLNRDFTNGKKKHFFVFCFDGSIFLRYYHYYSCCGLYDEPLKSFKP